MASHWPAIVHSCRPIKTSRLGEVLSSERQLARQALDKLIVDRVRFTPVQIEGERTYRFEAKLSLGRICAAVTQNDGDVPDGI